MDQGHIHGGNQTKPNQSSHAAQQIRMSGYSHCYSLFTDIAPYNSPDSINMQPRDSIGVLLTAVDAA